MQGAAAVSGLTTGKRRCGEGTMGVGRQRLADA